MNRAGGKYVAPDASTEHHMRQGSEIWKGGLGATTATSPNGYEYPRAPIMETVSWDGPVGSDGGHSGNYNRNDRVSGGRRTSFNNRNQECQWVGEIYSDDEDERKSNRSHQSGDSLNSSPNGPNHRRVMNQSLLPKFLTRPEIRPPRAAVSREVDYVTMPKTVARRITRGILLILLEPLPISMVRMVPTWKPIARRNLRFSHWGDLWNSNHASLLGFTVRIFTKHCYIFHTMENINFGI